MKGRRKEGGRREGGQSQESKDLKKRGEETLRTEERKEKEG